MSTLNEIIKRDKVMDLVAQEIESAIYKRCCRISYCKPDGDFTSPHEAYAILKEELEELWEDIKNDDGKSYHANREAIQVAAMAIKYVMSYGDLG